MGQLVDLTQYQYIRQWPDGVYPGEIDANARAASMAAHPAGKGRGVSGIAPAQSGDVLDGLWWRDEHPGIEALLREALASSTKLPDFEDAVFSTLYECADLLISKQADYGPDAINLSPGGPLAGINVRMHDKMMRAQHLGQSGAEPNHESLVDTYRDLANYAVIAVMVLDGTWPQ